MEDLQARIAAVPYWYHRIDLGNGIVTPGWAPLRPEAYKVPERLDGEKVLDVGAWDGYWSIEAIKRGAKQCTAMDDFSDTCGELVNAKRNNWQALNLCCDALGINSILKLETDIERYWVRNAVFDRIFCFGVLYHLRNPVLALQNCFDALKSGGTIHVETAILDDIQSPYTGHFPPKNACYAEFYPTNEFGKNKSNWWVPTLKCAASWLAAVGFQDIEGWKLTEQPQSLAECRGFLKAIKA